MFERTPNGSRLRGQDYSPAFFRLPIYGVTTILCQLVGCSRVAPIDPKSAALVDPGYFGAAANGRPGHRGIDGVRKR